MVKYLSRLLPIGILLLIIFAGWVPSIVETLKPDTYWVQLWVPNVERYLQPIVFVAFVITLVIYLIYRVWRTLRSEAVVEVLSERESTIIFLIDFALLILTPFIVGYIFVLFIFAIFASGTPGPYHLNSLSYNSHQYNVMLSPYGDDNAMYVVYECDLQGEQCAKYSVFESIGPSENFWDIAEYSASLGVADNKLYLCIRDRNDIELRRDVLAATSHWYPGENDPLCKDKLAKMLSLLR